jgi:large subunit ribosomal protein L9
MNVILLQDVDKLGRIGQVVSVARGYARNYLIPRGLAATATEGQQSMLAERVRQEAKRDQKHKRVAQDLAARYKELSCTITVQAGEDDKLFGSVTERDIAVALAEQELAVEHRQVVLEEPIKQLGVYAIPIKLHPEVEVTCKVWVVKA